MIAIIETTMYLATQQDIWATASTFYPNVQEPAPNGVSW